MRRKLGFVAGVTIGAVAAFAFIVDTLDLAPTLLAANTRYIALGNADGAATRSACSAAGGSCVDGAGACLSVGTTFMDGLTDVTLTTPADGSLLLYEATAAQWIDNLMSGDCAILDTGAIDCTNVAWTGLTSYPAACAAGSFVSTLADAPTCGAVVSFVTVTTSAGTSPVADLLSDTLTVTGTAPIIVTGTATTDTIVISLGALNLQTTTLTGILDDEVLVGTATGTGAYTPLVNCDDVTGKLDWNGTIFTCATDGGGGGGASDLNGLSDVTLTTPADGSLLLYEATAAQWIDNSMSGDCTILDTGAIECTQADALESDPANCGVATQFAVGITNTGVATCEAIADADVPSILTLELEASPLTNLLDDEVLVGTGPAAGTYTQLQNCDDTTGKLDWNGTGFTCVTDATGGGGGSAVDERCFYVDKPAAFEQYATVWRAPQASTITEIYCYDSAAPGDTVEADLLIGPPASPAYVNGTYISCAQGTVDNVLAGDTSLAQGDTVFVELGTITGVAPMSFTICWRMTIP